MRGGASRHVLHVLHGGSDRSGGGTRTGTEHGEHYGQHFYTDVRFCRGFQRRDDVSEGSEEALLCVQPSEAVREEEGCCIHGEERAVCRREGRVLVRVLDYISFRLLEQYSKNFLTFTAQFEGKGNFVLIRLNVS